MKEKPMKSNCYPDEIMYLDKPLTFIFGIYKGEPIRWRILASVDDAVLVISESIIEYDGYCVEKEKFKVYSLDWLNTVFLSEAFSQIEQQMILDIKIDDYNSMVKVWNLSEKEALKLFASDHERIAYPGRSACNHPDFPLYAANESMGWALRNVDESFGEKSYWYITEKGHSSFDTEEYIWFVGLRPAIWVKKECLPFCLPNAYRFFSAVQIGVYREQKLFWTELANIDDRHLLLCNHIVEYLPFNTEYTGIGWDQSSVRSWLNNEFYDQTFSAIEKKMIVEYTMQTNNTVTCTDKVFLLSADEVKKYLPKYEFILHGPAPYLSPQHIGQYIGVRERDVWLLRSNAGYGKNQSEIANVIEHTEMLNNQSNSRIINDGGRNLNVNGIAGIRPSIWVRY